MNANISIVQLNNLRCEYKAYLRITHSAWSDSTVSAIVADAFFALHNNVGVDFWASLADEESLIAVRNKIRDYLTTAKMSGNAEERADSYLLALKHLKQFLDEKHPALASDWSGKTISDVNLKADFQSWMKKQRKSTGDRYSSNMVNAYTTALKNATGKLGLGDAVYSDLFYYTSFDDFLAARNLILASDRFDEVNQAAGNKAYSNGMVMYEQFLKELGEPSAWIFQGNPKYYDVVGAVESLDTITWTVNQYPKQIKKGDKAYIWLSGSDGGIIASGTIHCDPEMKPPNLSDPYKRGDSLKTEPFLAVDIKLERKLIFEKVPRSVLLVDDRTKQLEILTYPGATNFRVTKAQEKVIESIIDGSYERVPVVETPKEEAVVERRYWLYSPGEQARLWDEFFDTGIMGIGWDKIGDITKYESKGDIKGALKEKYDATKSYRNVGLAFWQFTHEMAVGDVVFAKRGMSAIIGRGIVESDYIFDDERSEYKHIRKVNWSQKGEWEHPGQAAMKALTDITRYTEYVEDLESLLRSGDEVIEIDDALEISYPDYSTDDFLNEVYISSDKYEQLKGLLLRKKNIILQGAPGVGKTFAAQRLAFSIMGVKDTSRVKVVQFHQSYSYEDFVMGYRPDGNGFKLAEGPFYKFCKAAEGDDERPYFFIIDEINRGNLSRIFGELLMLIEADKRGEKNAMRLLYKDEQFSVPANVHIIGMMNTADRSLAMIDYALRRRFAFFDMEPAFAFDGFRNRQSAIANPKFDLLISLVSRLNEEIAKDVSLGTGFRIGHSYFCTTEMVNDAWISSVIEYELIPLLLEYWFDEPSKVESWSARLRGVPNDG